MRHSLRAFLALGLVALICAGAASATAAHRSAARAPIICSGAQPPPCCQPLVARSRVIPCCLAGSSQPGVIPCCVPTIVPCPGITIASSPDPSRARQPVTITGRLLTASSGGVTVVLWQKLPSQKSFHRVAQATTDSTGNYKFTRPRGTVQTNRTWYVTARGRQSLSIAQMVKAAVSLNVTAQAVGGGERVTFKGRVSPSHAGEQIQLQERTAGGWTLLAGARLGGSSTFSMSKLFARSSTAVVRAALGADSKNVASYSAPVHTKL